MGDGVLREDEVEDLKARLNRVSKQKLGVDWFLPSKKRRFATSTQSTSSLLSILAEEGLTFREALSRIHYDNEAKDIVRYFILNGFGDQRMDDFVTTGR